MGDTELKEGMKAPDFTLPGTDNKVHTLNGLLGHKYLIFLS